MQSARDTSSRFNFFLGRTTTAGLLLVVVTIMHVGSQVKVHGVLCCDKLAVAEDIVAVILGSIAAPGDSGTTLVVTSPSQSYHVSRLAILDHKGNHWSESDTFHHVSNTKPGNKAISFQLHESGKDVR